MCGIIGCISLEATGIPTQASKVLHSMMLASTQRGVDGTGIVVGLLDHDVPVEYYKAPLPVPQVVDKKDMERMTKEARWLVGHTRAATMGELVAEATHPFSEGSLVGVHNGTIMGAASMFPAHKDGINDSQIVYKALADVDPDKACEVLTKLDEGAYALVWYDARIKALRFARNNDRPLWFHKTAVTWWFASEPGNIAASLARHTSSAPLSYADILPWQLEPYVLMTIPMDGSEATAETYEQLYSYANSGYGTGSYGTGSWGGYRGGYGRGWDAWDDGSMDAWDDVSAPAASGNGNWGLKPDGWVSITSGDDMYTQPQWFGDYRYAVRSRLEDLLRSTLPRGSAQFTDKLVELARRTGTTDDQPVIQFVGQAITESTGMLYGATTLDTGESLPVVGLLSNEQHALYKERVKKAEAGYYPMYQGTITNLKAYADGSIGMGVQGLVLMSWVSEEKISRSERCVGSHTTHPHLCVTKEDADWSIWKAV